MAIGFGSEFQIITSALICRMSREEQQHVVERLEYLLGALVDGLDGFLSATLERGLRGDVVVAYIQWQTENHYAAMMKQPAVQDCLQKIEAVCRSVHVDVLELARTFEPADRLGPLPALAAYENPTRLQ
jgi:hypothetical protein